MSAELSATSTEWRGVTAPKVYGVSMAKMLWLAKSAMLLTTHAIG